ncbi:MAG: hypothetical protein ND895_17910 [Pyrinomonadaceae bacterium]|nr:hypothetical protein [Pyrinomonadaceae bacterium]
MATWQFALYLLPRSRLLELYGAIPSKVDWDTFDTLEWWRGKKLSEEAEPFLDSFLGRGTHWHKETLMWGDIESDHVDISEDGEVFARIDLRRGGDKFTGVLIDLAVKCNCLMWLPENEKLIEPELDILHGEIRGSGAFHFLSDPVGFLKSIEIRKNLEREDDREY